MNLARNCLENQKDIELLGVKTWNWVFEKVNLLPYFAASRYSFASGSPDNVKQWKFPDGNFLQNLSGHNAIINSLACNSDGVLVSAGWSEFVYSPTFSKQFKWLGYFLIC